MGNNTLEKTIIVGRSSFTMPRDKGKGKTTIYKAKQP